MSWPQYAGVSLARAESTSDAANVEAPIHARDPSPTSRFPAFVAPAPVRPFTIAEVMQNPKHLVRHEVPAQDRGLEPFGAVLNLAPEGPLWTKWRKVIAETRAEEQNLGRCLIDSSRCSRTNGRFAAIVNDARALRGRAKVELVNQRINATIHYRSDLAQWGAPDVWSAPLDPNKKGSFETGFGDCEDYAIAKYIALREADVAAIDLRLLVGSDRMIGTAHAVLAVRADGHWLLLDNRWDGVVEDADASRFEPIFALDEQGTKWIALPRSANISSLR
jgi:predicted transglutaminase-like cysteine proteinase